MLLSHWQETKEINSMPVNHSGTNINLLNKKIVLYESLILRLRVDASVVLTVSEYKTVQTGYFYRQVS